MCKQLKLLTIILGTQIEVEHAKTNVLTTHKHFSGPLSKKQMHVGYVTLKLNELKKTRPY